MKKNISALIMSFVISILMCLQVGIWSRLIRPSVRLSVTPPSSTTFTWEHYFYMTRPPSVKHNLHVGTPLLHDATPPPSVKYNLHMARPL